MLLKSLKIYCSLFLLLDFAYWALWATINPSSILFAVLLLGCQYCEMSCGCICGSRVFSLKTFHQLDISSKISCYVKLAFLYPTSFYILKVKPSFFMTSIRREAKLMKHSSTQSSDQKPFAFLEWRWAAPTLLYIAGSSNSYNHIPQPLPHQQYVNNPTS